MKREAPAGRIRSRDERETERIGERLATELRPGDLVLLEGDLGTGKTVLVRGLARGLGLDPDAIVSPSFVLAIWHRGGRFPLLHVDLYRLPEGAGIEELGIDDALAAGAIVAVEWGERIPPSFTEGAHRVRIAPGPKSGERTLEIIRPVREDYSSR